MSLEALLPEIADRLNLIEDQFGEYAEDCREEYEDERRKAAAHVLRADGLDPHPALVALAVLRAERARSFELERLRHDAPGGGVEHVWKADGFRSF